MAWQQWLEQGDWIQRQHFWVLEVFTIVFVTLVANWLLKRLFTRLDVKLRATRNLWDDVLLEAARRPAEFGVWLLGIAWAAGWSTSVPLPRCWRWSRRRARWAGSCC